MNISYRSNSYRNMEKYESENFRGDLISEFRKLDEILESFQNQFSKGVLTSINEMYPDLVCPGELEELVLRYANQIFNTAESVCDKDKNYNEFRLADEVNVMSKVVSRLSEENRENKELANRIHQMAKEMMVKFNPDLMDLSAEGFRLLEKYALMYNLFFMGGFFNLMHEE